MAAVVGVVCVGATLVALTIVVIVLWLRFTPTKDGSGHSNTQFVRAGSESYKGLTTVVAGTRSENRSTKQSN